MRALPAAAVLLLLAAAPARAAELETIFFENRFEAIEQAATARLKRAPGEPQALAWRAEALMKQGAFAEARQDLAALPAEGRDPAIARGDFAWYTGDWAGAQAHYEAARRAAPGDAHATWGVASALLHLDQFEGCLREAAPLLALGDREGASFRAWTLVLKGAALGLKADRGNVLDKLVNGPAAKAEFEAAMKADPGNANALSALGRFYYFAPGLLGGDPAKAVELLDRSNRADPYFFLNHAFLIRAHLKAGSVEKARVERTYYRAKFAGVPAAERELATIDLK